MITLMVRAVVTADTKTCELFDELRSVPFRKRQNDERLTNLVQAWKQKWSSGNKIERMATLGWDDTESCTVLSEMLEHLPTLRDEYTSQIEKYGKPPEWTNNDLEKFNESVNTWKTPR